jgi:hypothetical protein
MTIPRFLHDTSHRKATFQGTLWALAFLLTLPPQAVAIKIYSEGYLTPETISRAPASFGPYGGHYFIPDFGRGSFDPSLHKIWIMPPTGGAPSVFATNPNIFFLGGLFLPDTGWGVNSGRFLATGRFPSVARSDLHGVGSPTPTPTPITQGEVYVYDSAGSALHFAEIAGANLAQPRIAPPGFGTFGGQVIIAGQGSVLALSPTGVVTTVATTATGAWGLTFVPDGFGTHGGQFLTSSAADGSIVSISADGASTPFVNLALASGQTGLRQMEFSPPGFIAGYGSLLFVSVSGSPGGGGTLGDILVLDSDGNVVRALRTDLGLKKFDPRGLLFTNDGNLLICDSSDPIYLATPADFAPPATPTPTPGATSTPSPGGSATPTPTAAPSATPSATAAPTPSATPSVPAGHLGNISTRLRVEMGDNVLIGGFIVPGTQPKRVILRAIGPSLTTVGVPDALTNPILELHGPAGFVTITNHNWMDAPNRQEIIDSGLAPTNTAESAILVTLPSNNAAYTAIVRGVNNGTGVGLVEAYDLNPTADSKLANISTRGFVQAGDNVMIGGFIVVGQSATRAILRAIGPSLSISGKLADPTLELRNVNGTLLRSDDNWRTGGQEAEIIQTGIQPSNDLESAIISTLVPGNYTAIMRGVGNATGIGLIEAYDLGPP